MKTVFIILGILVVLVIIYFVYRYYTKDNTSKTSTVGDGIVTSVTGNENTPDGIINNAITTSNLNKTVYASTTVHPYIYRTDSGDGAFPEYKLDLSLTYPTSFNLGKFKESFSAYDFDKLVSLAAPAIHTNPTSSNYIYWNQNYIEQQLKIQLPNIVYGERMLLHGKAVLKRQGAMLGEGYSNQETIFDPSGAVITLYKVTGVDGVDRFYKKEDVNF